MDSGLRKTLLMALEQERRICMIYESGGKYTERTVRVIELREDAVYAYCYLRRKRRLFKLANILSAQLL